MLNEIDRLEKSLISLAADEQVHDEVTLRLRSLLSRLDGKSEQAEQEAIADAVQSASDDELFDLLDDQLETP
ncbi:hypothetical protein STBA_08050 [Streptomyces sp. MP131-18]|nr:hypothetical protein STBA_08050 [Streptomyces sp. MP131-18]